MEGLNKKIEEAKEKKKTGRTVLFYYKGLSAKHREMETVRVALQHLNGVVYGSIPHSQLMK